MMFLYAILTFAILPACGGEEFIDYNLSFHYKVVFHKAPPIEKYNFTEKLANLLVLPNYTAIISMFSLGDYNYETVWSDHTFTLLSWVVIIYLILDFLNVNWSPKYILTFLIVFGWIWDFVFTWINLFQVAEADKIVTLKKFNYAEPPGCDLKTMATGSYIKSSTDSSNDCQDYYNALRSSHFYSISPLTVFSHQFGIFCHSFASFMGRAIGSFCSLIVLENLPWGVNIILLPLILIYFLMWLCVYILMFSKKSAKISFAGIFKIDLGIDDSHEKLNEDDNITVDNLPMILDH